MKDIVDILLSYPLFRLTLFMLAGIFLFDSSILATTSIYVSLGGMLVSCILCACIYSFPSSYKSVWFGLFSCIGFFFLGGSLTLYRYNAVYTSWPETSQYYVGVVETLPVAKARSYAVQVRLLHTISSAQDSASLSRIPITTSALLYLAKTDSLLLPGRGDTLAFYSRISVPQSTAHVTNFDYPRYLLHQGIGGTAYVPNGRWYISGHCISPDLRCRALMMRDRISQIFEQANINPESEAVIRALTIGDKSELTPQLRSMYTAAGTSHILALSGMHIGILAAILLYLLYPLRYVPCGDIVRYALATALLWAFAFVTGLSPSAVRAVTMFTLFVVAHFLLDERYGAWYALTVTAFLMLVYNPYYIFHISFQLSFVAVVSILLFYPLICGLLRTHNIVVRYLWNAMSVSVSAQLGTLPIILFYFGTFPTYFIIANLIVAPMAVLILSAAVFALAMHLFFPAATMVFLPVDYLTRALNSAMHYILHLHSSQITSVYLSGLQAVLLSLFILCIYRSWHKRSFRRVVSALLVLILFLASVVVQLSRPIPVSMHFVQSSVYISRGRSSSRLKSPHGIMSVGNYNVAVVKDNTWTSLQSSHPISIDYLYICGGYYGDVRSLLSLFRIGNIIIDSSMDDSHIKKLVSECKLLKISYSVISDDGSYSVNL